MAWTGNSNNDRDSCGKIEHFTACKLPSCLEEDELESSQHFPLK